MAEIRGNGEEGKGEACGRRVALMRRKRSVVTDLTPKVTTSDDEGAHHGHEHDA